MFWHIFKFQLSLSELSFRKMFERNETSQLSLVSEHGMENISVKAVL